MSVGMDKTTKTINQPLARKISKTTLGKVVGKVGILSKPPACKQTHTLPAQGNRNPRWAFHTGHPGEDYIGDLPGHVHSTAFEHKQNTKTLSLLMVHPVYVYVYIYFPYTGCQISNDRVFRDLFVFERS